jgi:Circularly permutated YpsA SLOG family
MNLKIISGGQTGIDLMGLEVARELGLPTGGSAPKSFGTGRRCGSRCWRLLICDRGSNDCQVRTFVVGVAMFTAIVAPSWRQA